MPHQPGLGDIAALGRVDRVEMALAFAVLRILSVGDVDLVLVDHRRADDLVAGLRPDRGLRVRVEFPELLAGEDFVTADPAVPLRADDLVDAADFAHRGCGPLAVQDLVADRVVFPGQLPGDLVDRDDRRRFR